MKIAYLIEPERIEIREVPIPEPKPEEVLLKIKAALTCGTDLKAYRRGHPMIPMPGPFGHEFSGIASKVGSLVKQFKEGDAIMSVHSAPCGECKFCKKGIFNHCDLIMKHKILGAFAEYIVLPKHILKYNTFIKPPQLDFSSAAMLEPLSCVVHGLSGLSISANHRIAIVGNGPIAILHLLMLKQKCSNITLIGRNKSKLENAMKFGANEILLLDDIKTNPNLYVFDFVFECTGDVSVWELTPSIACKGGVIILFGGCKVGTKASFDTYKLHYDEITLKGSFHFTPDDVKSAYSLLSSGLDVSMLISDTFSLEQINDLFQKHSSGQGLKYCLEP